MGEYIYEVLFDFPAEDEGELSIYAGECVRSSTDVDDEGWLFVTSEDNSSGYVPKEYLRLIPGGTSTSESKSTKNDVVATSNANLEVTKTAVEEAPIQKVELEVASSPKIQSPVVEAIKPSPLPATAPESATPESTAPVSLSTPLMPVSYQAAAPSIVPPPHLQSSEVDSTPAPSASTTSRVSKSSTAGAMSSSHTSATPMRSVSQNPVSPTYSMSSASKLSFSKAGKGVLAASKLASLGTSINTSKTIAPPRPPALVAAVERDNMADLLKKNDDYFNRVINSQVCSYFIMLFFYEVVYGMCFI